MWEGKLAASSDYRVMPTFVTLGTMDANVEGVGMKRRRDTVLILYILNLRRCSLGMSRRWLATEMWT
jgi:hypothetical protein